MAMTVVVGGPQSGKSRFGLSMAAAQGPRLGFIATRLPLTPEAEQECLRLRDERRDAFVTWEEPLRVPDLVETHRQYFDALVVDDAVEWLGNLAAAGWTDAEAQLDRLCALAAAGPAHLVVVASDGAGGLPEVLVARADHLFRLTDGVPVRVR